jgi:hypothetical protein
MAKSEAETAQLVRADRDVCGKPGICLSAAQIPSGDLRRFPVAKNGNMVPSKRQGLGRQVKPVRIAGKTYSGGVREVAEIFDVDSDKIW